MSGSVSHAMAAHPDLVAEITTDIEKSPCRWSSDPAAAPSWGQWPRFSLNL